MKKKLPAITVDLSELPQEGEPMRLIVIYRNPQQGKTTIAGKGLLDVRRASWSYDLQREAMSLSEATGPEARGATNMPKFGVQLELTVKAEEGDSIFDEYEDEEAPKARGFIDRVAAWIRGED